MCFYIIIKNRTEWNGTEGMKQSKSFGINLNVRV